MSGRSKSSSPGKKCSIKKPIRSRSATLRECSAIGKAFGRGSPSSSTVSKSTSLPASSASRCGTRKKSASSAGFVNSICLWRESGARIPSSYRSSHTSLVSIKSRPHGVRSLRRTRRRQSGRSISSKRTSRKIRWIAGLRERARRQRRSNARRRTASFSTFRDGRRERTAPIRPLPSSTRRTRSQIKISTTRSSRAWAPGRSR